MKKLDIIATLKEGIALGLLNYVSVLVAFVLYIITIWIPYINVGTTIALQLLPVELAKGKIVNPLYIFDGKYRRNMGEFFILMGILYIGIMVGFCFMFIPGLVISYAWGLAVMLFVDKNMNALEALRESNKLTYGNKWRIFGVELILGICFQIVALIINGLFGIGDVEWLMTIGTIIVVLIVISAMPISIATQAVIYKKLVLEKDEPTEEVAAEEVVAETAE